jgi:baculoviral IAP repeat-containing protein 6
MIFNDQPFYNEPGYEYRADETKSEKYNRKIELLTIKYAMLPWLTNALMGAKGFLPEGPRPKNTDQQAKGKNKTGLKAVEAKTSLVMDALSQKAGWVSGQEKFLAGQAGDFNELESLIKPKGAHESTKPSAGPSKPLDGEAATNGTNLPTHPANATASQAHQGGMPSSSHVHPSNNYSSPPNLNAPKPSPANASTSQAPKAHSSTFSGAIPFLNAPLSPSQQGHPIDHAHSVHSAHSAFFSVLPDFSPGKQRVRPQHAGDDPVWADVIRTHFSLKTDMILATVREWERRSFKGGNSSTAAGDMAAVLTSLEYELKRHGFND